MKPLERRHRLSLLYDIGQLCLYGDSKTVICDWTVYGEIPDRLVDEADRDYVQALLRELVRRDDPALQLCDEHQNELNTRRWRAGIPVPEWRNLRRGWFDRVYGNRSDTIRRLLG